ncbi:hypothetical protein MNBD_GAMMA12-3248 [hydrothermal vent metagenome]|uniref:Nucleotidyltransferase n=1 Tax=hydrothermal vent metagenome TaxID=652676 RepID=A0A3B0YDL2_9ZZZZ
MTSTLLNIAGKIDSQTVKLFESVCLVTSELALPYVVVGATARDLILHHGHGANIQRATSDIDFAIEVSDWESFALLTNSLCRKGFKPSKVPQRLLSPDNIPVDIVPFGRIEDPEASIAWPPDGDVVMSVLGFQEACDHAERVRIHNAPVIDIRVATPPGMILLKLIAWIDRAVDMRIKDAKDIAYLLSTYEKISAVVDAGYDDSNIVHMESYDWDVTQTCSFILGQHAKSIAGKATRKEIVKLATGEGHTVVCNF